MKPEKRMYDSVRWRKARAYFLQGDPLCVFCQKVDRLTPATTVDHIIPHGGDPKLFWDQSNWQGLCKSCHDSLKRAKEKTGIMPGCDLDGNPIDQDHTWNRYDKAIDDRKETR